jgi:hypothetical protein
MTKYDHESLNIFQPGPATTRCMLLPRDVKRKHYP